MFIVFLVLALIIFPLPTLAWEASPINQYLSETDSAWFSYKGIVKLTEEGVLFPQVNFSLIEFSYELKDFDLSFDVYVREYGTYGSLMLLLMSQDSWFGYVCSLGSSISVRKTYGYWDDSSYKGISKKTLPTTIKSLPVQKWSHVEVTSKSGTYTILIDGEKVYEFADNEFPQGGLVIESSNSSMELKNISLIAPDEPKIKTQTPFAMPSLDYTKNKPQNSKITGTFLYLDNSNIRDDAGSWAEEFAQMKDAGIDLLVVAPYFYSDPLYSVLDELFNEAEKQGLQIMIGSRSNNEYHWTNLGKRKLTAMLEITLAELTELNKRYAGRPAFFGWYLNDEIDEKDFLNNRFRKATWYYGEMIDHLKSLTPDKPILICPSYASNTAISWWTNKYNEFLKLVKIDILGPQDSVGAKRSTPEEAAKFFAAVKQVTDLYNIQLWADVEIFDIDTWQPGSSERVMKQLLAVDPYVEKTIVFEYNHYMNPNRSLKTKKLYHDYLAWLNE